MPKIAILNATIINEGKQQQQHLLINGRKIERISDTTPDTTGYDIIDATGLILMPGVIDDQVHFREPGLEHKGDIASESKAAAAGGVTSYMEMPNTKPPTVTINDLNRKYDIASSDSYVNYSFYMGATNNNLNEVLKIDPKAVCGVKVFMGSSTGNMLVDDTKTLEGIFKESPTLIATHCEDEGIIKANTKAYFEKYGDDIPLKYHPVIRSAEACYKSSSKAVELATRFGSQLHILHLSTAKELDLFEKGPLENKKITAEICVHHLWFNETDYERKKTFIKWNPAIKTKNDQESLFQGLLNDKLDVIATDHAPHTFEEKNNPYMKAPSGGPLIQHSLQVMLQFHKKGMISLEKIVDKMCHAPAKLYKVANRGYIREGYFADLVLVDPNTKYTVSKNNILYKCHWSPFENETFNSSVKYTIVNGEVVFKNGEVIKKAGERLMFNR